MTDTSSELRSRLDKVKAKRGYLLPHHGLLATLSERMIEAYDGLYTALALDHKVLSVRDRELVWLAVLIATDEAIATHHIPKFREGGGTQEEFVAVLRLTSLVLGSGAYSFVEQHWEKHWPNLSTAQEFVSAVEITSSPLSRRDAWLCTCAILAAKARFSLLREAIMAAYRAGIVEFDLAEALSIMIFPGSVPHFVEASRVWMELIRDGSVTASPTFAIWAGLEGQGGYDEASGRL